MYEQKCIVCGRTIWEEFMFSTFDKSGGKVWFCEEHSDKSVLEALEKGSDKA
ncbi:hypothetical protein NYE80_24155 [Paenibacillus sp. FSL H7-0357]|uniref:hypothetical protein n=1 Tax=Paenibacillus sp. FSL H7-0357 TaxID=1536774 RepID=UPI000A6F538B|nr:hypothetical protein [Paenibacillus sp. FSL H7-0357]